MDCVLLKNLSLRFFENTSDFCSLVLSPCVEDLIALRSGIFSGAYTHEGVISRWRDLRLASGRYPFP